MNDTHDLLIEIGTEELPPKALRELRDAFARGVTQGLAEAGLEVGVCQAYAAPRRLAVWIKDVPPRQADQSMERRGPAVSAAFDADGQPTRAAQGFAGSCGVAVSELERMETDKGAWLVHRHVEPGRETTDLVPGVVESALAALPIPKRMRWGDGDAEFVRPVHWVILLLGDREIPATLLGVSAGRETRGHRFHHPEPLRVPEPAAYADLLAQQGHVLADFDTRRETIRSQVEQAAAELGGRAVLEEALLDEVTALVEWPVAVVGHFESRFLEVPQEALILTMQDNQKYFAVVDGQGRLMPHFITISNVDSREPERVREGNERVIRPRFADAEFFWKQDRQRPLESHLDGLRHVVFQQKLGSLHAKTLRVEQLAGYLAGQIGAPEAEACRAAHLCKCDLQTLMVYEFTELQGTMGRYYAQHDGEAASVARALEDQYLPRHAGDDLPGEAVGRVLALADRLDTLVGIFAIGLKPTGAKDPFGLRRAALGVLRILVEAELPLDLEDLLQQAARGYGDAVPAMEAVPQVLDYVMERLRAYYHDRGIRPEVFDAVLSVRPTRPLDFDRRVRAVETFLGLPEAEPLAAAHKRIHNILRKVEGDLPEQVDPERLQEDAERALHERLEALWAPVSAHFDVGEYTQGLTELATLREPVDAFFDQVMVMAEDAALRDNRLALLNRLAGLFLRVADLSRVP
ncbi:MULTISPECIES: glycine--tRNA ligase subunit beta [unclassified Ectothiorhodospira]|uniref:glycine--tRNA ligase subunit beta n=1 Tax=unclassified Ectothiorhodospira TaxID=2684909 RepID=UPI001EE91FE2|nr:MULTISPECIES: glycine--tRNA ligase subunit beta [unclassified Ectothiorhodospira]MCG5516177.1 glycine--tRNA ligase subunit beta [Ectothiorhodospira sp. 9100]MCG5519595.1 glycine--tRNA ligase subunit beta [Ectothiorhodospira sp. 9905]